MQVKEAIVEKVTKGPAKGELGGPTGKEATNTMNENRAKLKHKPCNLVEGRRNGIGSVWVQVHRQNYEIRNDENLLLASKGVRPSPWKKPIGFRILKKRSVPLAQGRGQKDRYWTWGLIMISLEFTLRRGSFDAFQVGIARLK